MPNRRTPLAGLPFWPRNLSREEAARYVGVGVDTFDAEVRAGYWPDGDARGSRGGRLTWDRELLDAAQDRKSQIRREALGTFQPSVVAAPVLARGLMMERMDASSSQQRPKRRPQAPR